ncbi:TetR/AcrR family transcriptional regulator [Gallaecimonas xiamenensis]|uniref:TetR family transcriptional regulator n=1 Tax=Gallaecimonas xiamenensis 3-C-1 TaxID=745411 RepID=K2IZF8_9GAMM|nr:TetR/AcrR family transcriptional regulator [Gallaecimonas xiamenensis]EKE75926.1 TetR family transcriptional regulator [Gallaecimonas xiamenensis 3-C-1]
MTASDKQGDKEHRILEATENLLALYGFHGLSMQLVAKEAGVAAGTIYRYFESKTALILAVHRKIVEEVSQALFDGYDPKASLHQRFNFLWDRSWLLFIETPQLLRCKFQFDHLPAEHDLQRMRELEAHHFAPMSDFWEQGIEEGVFKDLPHELLSSLTFEVCFGLAYKQLTLILTLTQSQMQATKDACWQAICVAPSRSGHLD